MLSGGNKFSRTFQDLKLQFPGFPGPVILQDVPGPGILKKTSRTFHEAWEPCWEQINDTNKTIKLKANYRLGT